MFCQLMKYKKIWPLFLTFFFLLLLFSSLLRSFSVISQSSLENVVFFKKNGTSLLSKSSSQDFEEGFLSESIWGSERKYNHSPSMAILKDGRFFVVWYAGDREGGDNMEIRYAILKKGEDRNEKILISSNEIPFCHRLGNPIVYVHPEIPEKINIVFVSTLAGWATSYLNVMTSSDNGVTFTQPKCLWLGNLLNFSHLVRGNPFFLKGGQVGIPIYHECINKFGMILFLDENHSILGHRKLSLYQDAIQPQILFSQENQGIAFFRNTNVKKYGSHVLMCYFDDKGFGKMRSLNIPNDDSSIATIRYGEVTFVIYNESLESQRLAIGGLDRHFNFKKIMTVDSNFSKYPYVVGDEDYLHLLYASKGRGAHQQDIKYKKVGWDFLLSSFYEEDLL